MFALIDEESTLMIHADPVMAPAHAGTTPAAA
jgi:hypothetical protein